MLDVVIVGGGISGLYLYSNLIDKSSNILLLEQNNYYGGRIYQFNEKINNIDVSVPAGAARFNKNHTEVIKLLKKYNLLDFRKDKGFDSAIKFIDTKQQFSNEFNDRNGFYYIDKVIKQSRKEKEDILRQESFRTYASKYLTKEELEFMLVASGYSGQLKYMNAYDACNLFSKGIRPDIKYYGGYYHTLIEELVKELKSKKGNLRLNSHVNDFKYDKQNDIYVVKYNNKTIETKKLVLCIPQQALLNVPFLKTIHPLLKNSIKCKALCRVYALFKKEDIWFQDVTKTVVNNPLRYVIPFDESKGLIMISYTDDKYTNFWGNLKEDQEELKKQIVKYVRETFQKEINEPEKVWVFNWDCGVTYWLPKKNSKEISETLLNPFQNMYICGENYSLNQSWVEGALETVNSCLGKIKL